MKRITSKMKLLDLIATSIELLTVIIVFVLFLMLFSLYPSAESLQLDQTYPEQLHTFLGLNIWTSQVNLLIGTSVAYLILFVPLCFTGFKRVLNKEDIELDEWSYRNQYLLSFFQFITLGWVASAIRFVLAQEISYNVKDYGFITSVRKITGNIHDGIKAIILSVVWLYKKSANLFLKPEKRYKFESKQTKEQEEIEKLNKSSFIFKVLRVSATYTFLTLIALLIFIPFYWMFVTALKDYPTLTSDYPTLFMNPSDMQWINFKIALEKFDFMTYIWNTIWVGIVTMIGTVTTTVLAAFAFSRLEFKGKEFIFSLLLMTMMIPGELYTITNYITVYRIGWYDTFLAIIIPFMASVFYIFFLRQTFKQIPDTLYRAAKVDGCSDFKYLTRIMLPIASPTITTISILSAIGAWDAYVWPNLVISVNNKSHWLISVALRSTSFTFGPDRVLTNLQVAATALVTVPLLIIFFSLKKYIVQGVGRSGTKG